MKKKCFFHCVLFSGVLTVNFREGPTLYRHGRHLCKMLRNSILGHLKKTVQSIASESKIKFSHGRSVKCKKSDLAAMCFRRTSKFYDATVNFFNASKNGQRLEQVYSTIKHLSVQ